MKDEDIKLPEIDQTTLRFHVKGESPKIWDHIEKWSVSKAGLQATTLANNIDLAITEAMQEYARQAVRMNAPETYIAEQAKAWMSVVDALNSVMPGWLNREGSAESLAVSLIKELASLKQGKTCPNDPEPFDLARAMAGEPIVTRDGRKARFLVHVPEVKDEGSRVLVWIDGDEWVSHHFETGSYAFQEGIRDLFMAPKPKRTVWVNVLGATSQNLAASVHQMKERAIEAADENDSFKYFAIAHPIKIDA